MDEVLDGPGGAARRDARGGTRTSAAFGSVDVGPPVSRLPVDPAPAAAAAPVPAPPQRCPSCAARVRAGQQWCSLCHASLAPATALPASTTAPTTAPTTRPPAPVEEPAEVPAAAPAEGAALPDEEEVERMLRALADSAGAPVRGLGSPRAKIAVAAGGGLALTLLLLLAMTVLGALAG
ncbi:hypothetical protein [Kineococcus auxinigenes]|uniref:hypothetical protein n=1 Tax=unclassified Kineococcus TaxID=2621656 RepID=UPI003D7C6A80